MKIEKGFRLGLFALAVSGLAAPVTATANNCGMRPGSAGYAPAYNPYGRPMAPMPRGYGYGYGMPRPGYMPQPPRMAYSNTMATGAAPQVESGPTQAPDAPTGASIDIAQMRFDPPSLKIKSGDTVTWTQSDGMTHAIGSSDGSFDSPNLYRGSQFSYTFDKPGTYDYVCSLHPSMRGQIVVE